MFIWKSLLVSLLYYVVCRQVAAQGETISVTADSSTDTSEVKCVDNGEITAVHMQCASATDILHIVNLKLTYKKKCSGTASECQLPHPWLFTNAIEICEGQTGSCQFSVSNNSECASINHVSTTVRCISSESVYDMCPTVNMFMGNIKEPIVLATENFVIPNEFGGGYRPHTQCHCVITPLENAKVYVQALFMDIEPTAVNQTACVFDWVVVGNKQYCGFYDLVEGRDNLPSFTLGSSVSFSFVSDNVIEKRGAWFKVRTDEKATLELQCSPVNRTFNITTPSISSTPVKNISGEAANSSTERVTSAANSAPTTLAKTQDSTENPKKRLSAGIGIGVSITVLAGIIIAALVYYWYLRNKRRKSEGDGLVQGTRLPHSRLFEVHSSPSTVRSNNHLYDTCGSGVGDQTGIALT